MQVNVPGKCLTIFALTLIVQQLGAFAKHVRIIGGQNARIKTYPFVAVIRYINYDLVSCGGSIISNQHIITVAHCLINEPTDYNNIRVYTGITFTHDISREGHQIDRVFFHPQYTGETSNDHVQRHDLAIAKVKHVIVFNNYQKKIELPTRDIAENDSGYVLGWGSVNYPQVVFPSQLQKAYMFVFPSETCLEIYNLGSMTGQFCAFQNQNIGPCHGDSGGPLVIDKKLAGMVSFSIPCAEGIPDFYTNIYYYVDFIRQIINI